MKLIFVQVPQVLQALRPNSRIFDRSHYLQEILTFATAAKEKLLKSFVISN